MKRRILSILISCICISGVFVGCGNSNQNNGQNNVQQSESKKIDITKMNAEDIINEFKSAGFPINKIVVTTEENDVNNLMGRPNQYTSKINFSDKRIDQFDEENNPIGGTIEVFDNAKDAENRKEYVEKITTSVSVFTQYIYLYKNVLFRLDHELTPTQAKVYEDAFKKLQNGEEITFEETEETNNNQKENEQSTQIQDSSENKDTSLDKIKEAVQNNIGKGEQIKDFKLENKSIIVNIDLGTPSSNIPLKDLAISRYSSISDNLLEYDSWDTLTINFENVGTVTLNANEASSNTSGKYFESSLIEKQLN